MLPRWNGTAFVSGNATIRQEFVRLVDRLRRASPPAAPATTRPTPRWRPPTTSSATRARSRTWARSRSRRRRWSSIADVSVVETRGHRDLRGHALRSGGRQRDRRVRDHGADGTATAGADYAAASGTVTFPAGQTREHGRRRGRWATRSTRTTRRSGEPLVAVRRDDRRRRRRPGTIVDDDPLPTCPPTDCAVDGGRRRHHALRVRRCVLTPVSGRTGDRTATRPQTGTATAGTRLTSRRVAPSRFAAGVDQRAAAGQPCWATPRSSRTRRSRCGSAHPSNATAAGRPADGHHPGRRRGVALVARADARHRPARGRSPAARPTSTGSGSRRARRTRSCWTTVSGDAVPGLQLERLAADNVTVLQTATPVRYRLGGQPALAEHGGRGR